MRTKTFFLLFLILMSTMASAQSAGGPDNYGYTWKSSDNPDPDHPLYSWTDIAPTGTNLNLSDDSGSGAVNLSGDFYFYGNNYATLYVGSNGWVNFLENAYSPYHPFIYTGGGPNAFISPFGEDLNPDDAAANIYYQDDTQMCIIQYDKVPLYYDKGSYSFQIILDKRDSTITFNYQSSDSVYNWHYDAGTGTAVTGVENETGTTGLNIDNSILKDNFAIKFYQPAPFIYHDPDEISFSDIWVGKADSTELTLLNSGKTDLIISSISLQNGSDMSLPDLPPFPHTIEEINSGDLLKFHLKYTPTSENTLTDTVIILSNSADENSTLKIPVSATSLESDIAVLTPALDFGNVQVEYKDTKNMDVIVRNNGNAGLIINENSGILDGSFFDIAKLPSSLPFIIRPHTQDTLVVRFTPTAAGLFKDTLSLFNNTVGSSPQKIPLSGKGVESEIDFSPQTMPFDSTIQGRTDTLSFKLTNTGQYKLSVNSMQLVDNTSFSLIDSPVSFSLNPGENKEIMVGFTPLGTGAVTDSIRFSTNLPDLYYLNVSGTGILPVFNSDPDQLAFGQVILQDSKSDSLTISNNGIGDLEINHITFSDGTYFSLTDNLTTPFILPSAAEKTLHLNFTPTSLGFKFDGLEITTNLGTFVIQVQGKGIFPDLELSTGELDFGRVQVAQNGLDSLYLENSGTADLIIAAFDFEAGSNYFLENPPALPLTIQPFSRQMIKIRFTPDGATAFTDTLTISSNTLSAKKISLKGTGIFPGISLKPASLAFDSTLENSSANLSFWIKNSGSQNLHISSLKTGTDHFEVYPILKRNIRKGVNDLEFNIAVADSQQVRVEFTPDGNTLFTDSIMIDAEFIGTSYLPLRGQGTRAAFSLSATTVDFADSRVNTPVSQSITLTSTGNGLLTVDGFSDNLPEFSITNGPALPVTIYPGTALDFDVQFIPTALQPYLDTLTVRSSSPLSPAKIALAGNGIGGALDISRNLLNFGDISLATSARDSFYLKNYGNRNLNISGFQLTGDTEVMDVISPTLLPLQITPGDSGKVVVDFTPQQVKNYQAGLKIVCDGVFQNDTLVTLAGDGISANIFVTPSSLDFGYVHLDSSRTDSVTITNTGNAGLQITAFNFEDGSMFSLQAAPSLPLLIPQGENRKIYLNFSAGQLPGSYNDLLTIINNSGNNVDISLAATAAIGSIEASTSQLDYGSLNVGESSLRALTIRNTGNYSFTIADISVTGDNFTPDLSTFAYTVAAGDSTILPLTFTPLAFGNSFEILKIKSEFDDVEILLTGQGLQSLIYVAETTIDFGSPELPATSSSYLNLYNKGNIPLTVSEIPILSGGPFNVTEITLPHTINGGDSTQLKLNFNPDSPADFLDSLLITNSSTVQPQVNLMGKGLGSDVNLSTTLLNFGESVTSATLLDTITISNSGNKILTVDSLYLNDEAAFTFANPGELSLPLLLPPGELKRIIIAFTPPTVDIFTAKITIISDAYDATTDLCSLLGSGIAAGIEIEPDSLSYGIVKVGDLLQKTTTLTNDGNSILIIDSLIFASGSVFSLDQEPLYPLEIDPNESLELVLNFAPQTATEYQDTAYIYSNTDSLYLIPLSGEGGLPQLEVNTDTLNFSEVTVAASATIDFFLYNKGNFQAVLNTISNEDSHFSLSLPDRIPKEKPVSSKFRQQLRSSLTAEIPAYDSLRVRVKFKPATMTDYHDTITVTGEGDTSTVPLTGRGVKAILAMSENLLNFGSVKLGLQKTDSISIVNTGNTALVISGMESSGSAAFTIIGYDSLTFPLIVNIQDTLITTVQFSPESVGGSSNRIKYLSNNFAASQSYLYLTGAGEEQELEITPDTLDFANVDIGNIAIKTFTLKNRGTEEITVNEIDSDSSRFVLLNLPNLPYSIMPGGEVAVDVKFQPQNIAVYSDTVKIKTSVLNRDYIIRGVGSAPIMRITSSTLAFDSVYVSSGRVESFYIVNDGTSDLEINGIENNAAVFKYFILNTKDSLLSRQESNNNPINKTVSFGSMPKQRNKSRLAEHRMTDRDKFAIEAGDSLRVQVTFTPKATVLYESDLTINTNVGAATVALKGKGAAPYISLSQQEITFTDTETGTISSSILTVQNGSALPVLIDTLFFDNDLTFGTRNMTFPFTIAGNSSSEIDLTFQPEKISLYNSRAIMINNSGITPALQLSGKGSSLSYAVSELEHDFASVSVEDRISDSLQISNTSLAPLLITNIKMAKGIHFDLETAITYPFNLGSGQELNLKYYFHPKFYSEKILKDTIQIVTSAAAAEISLSGQAEKIDLQLSASAINFGTVAVNDSATVPLMLTNKGLARIEIRDILLEGGIPFDFNHSAGDYIMPGDSTMIAVQFKPRQITPHKRGGKELSAPQTVQLTVSEEMLTLSWEQVAGATGYNIYTSATLFSDFGEITSKGSFSKSSEKRIFWSIPLQPQDSKQTTLPEQMFFRITASNASSGTLAQYHDVLKIRINGPTREVSLTGQSVSRLREEPQKKQMPKKVTTAFR